MLRSWHGGPFKAGREEQDRGQWGRGAAEVRQRSVSRWPLSGQASPAAFHGFLACDAATSLKGRARGKLHLCLRNTRLGLGL